MIYDFLILIEESFEKQYLLKACGTKLTDRDKIIIIGIASITCLVFIISHLVSLFFIENLLSTKESNERVIVLYQELKHIS